MALIIWKKKSRLEQRAWEEYYASLEQNMEEENLLISDYPFSDKQKLDWKNCQPDMDIV